MGFKFFNTQNFLNGGVSVQALNPKNADSRIFKNLTKFFSNTNYHNFRTQMPTYKTKWTAGGYTKIGNSKHVNSYGKSLFSTASNGFDKDNVSLYDYIKVDDMDTRPRFERYRDFEQMEHVPSLASALDIYADELTYSSDMENIVTIDTNDQELKDILTDFLYNIFDIESNLFNVARNLVKYGEDFRYLHTELDKGIVKVVPIDIYSMERFDGGMPRAEHKLQDELLLNSVDFVEFYWNQPQWILQNWQVAHTRIIGNSKYFPYGTSVLDPARRVFRQLDLLENAMIAYRIVRAPDRRVFYVDVGGIERDAIPSYMESVKTKMKRQSVQNPETGQLDLRYNPMSIESDYYVAVRGERDNTKIDTLTGSNYNGAIEDVEYLRKKLFTAIKIPPSFINGEAGSEAKGNLAQQSTQFAKTIQRIQRSLVSELTKMCIVHLIFLKKENITDFTLKLNNPSKIAELQALEQLDKQLQIAQNASNSNFFSNRWISQEIFNISNSEYIRNKEEMFHDKKLEFFLNETSQGKFVEKEREEEAKELERINAEKEKMNSGADNFGGGDDDFGGGDDNFGGGDDDFGGGDDDFGGGDDDTGTSLEDKSSDEPLMEDVEEIKYVKKAPVKFKKTRSSIDRTTHLRNQAGLNNNELFTGTKEINQISKGLFEQYKEELNTYMEEENVIKNKNNNKILLSEEIELQKAEKLNKNINEILKGE